MKIKGQTTPPESSEAHPPGELSDFLIDRWQLLGLEIEALKGRRVSAATVRKTRAQLEQRYCLDAPSLLDKGRIVEHCEVELLPDQNAWGSADRQLTGRARVPTKRITFVVIRHRLSGDIALLAYGPTNRGPALSRSWIKNGAIHWRYMRASNADERWKNVFSQNMEELELALNHTRKTVNGFNAQVRAKLLIGICFLDASRFSFL